jgi:hypothetical protein
MQRKKFVTEVKAICTRNTCTLPKSKLCHSNFSVFCVREIDRKRGSENLSGKCVCVYVNDGKGVCLCHECPKNRLSYIPIFEDSELQAQL